MGFHLLGTVFERIGLTMLLPVFGLIQSGQEARVLAEDADFWAYLVAFYNGIGLEPTVSILLATSFLAILLRQVFVYFRIVFMERIRLLMVRDTRDRAVQAHLDVQLSHLDGNGLGSVVNNLTIEIPRGVSCLIAAVTIVGYVIMMSIYVVLLLALSVPMTVAALAVMALAALPVLRILRRTRQIGNEIVNTNNAILEFLDARLRSLRLIRLSGTQLAELDQMRDRSQKQFHWFLYAMILQARTTVAIEPIIVGAGFVFLYFGVSQFGLALEQVGLFMIVVLRLVPVVKEILTTRVSILRDQAALESVDQQLQGLRDHAERDIGSRPLEAVNQAISYKNVSLRYANATSNALTDIDIAIPAHRVTAFVGPSGAGKSSLIDLLPRLREPTNGDIFIDDVSVREFSLGTLRSVVSYAPQSPQIFNVSARDHIKYGRPDASDDEVIAAAARAGADDFIRALPDGYDTRVGDAGALLSGGQRQRLDLARALLKNAEILILDEPTSQLDADSEAHLRSALRRIREETELTVIIVGHRLSTVSLAEQIIVLRDGQIDDCGTHDELMDRGGWYADAYAKQHQSEIAVATQRQDMAHSVGTL